MQLYLVRHGVARDISESGVLNDVDRPLSPYGEKCTRQVAAGLARLSPQVSRIISSPLLRAMQTAEIFAQALAIDGAVESCDALASEQHVEEVIQWIKEQSDGGLMLVGHMPALALMVSRLVCGSNELASLHFEKAGLCRLSFDGSILPGTAMMKWLMPPSVFRALSGE
ncbi:MAG: phosphohistidine phosphatase SixA [Kiritimatiellae bacterium]|nr:phosphohistidine phosphatase SixA [Kiritimatiellia bacterium]